MKYHTLQNITLQLYTFHVTEYSATETFSRYLILPMLRNYIYATELLSMLPNYLHATD